MEVLEGGTLRERMVNGALPVETVVPWLDQILAAVVHAHAHGIVHRDLKPENVMLTSKGQLKVTDFGLARSVEVSRKLTDTGLAMGTPSYMAPEQIFGKTAPSADQYAIGIIAYELLAGQRPFEGEPMYVMFKHAHEDAPPLSELRPEVPHDLESLVMRMVRRDPAERFPDLQHARDRLRELYPDLCRLEQSRDPFPQGTFEGL
jgi:serine/threonine protein kinase